MPRKARPSRFKTISAKAVVNQLVGPERPYPVYRLPILKFERPERPATTYRWLT